MIFNFRPHHQTRLLMAVCAITLSACSSGEPSPAAMPPPTVGVWTVATTQATVTTELPGKTAPFAIAEIRPQVSGVILKRLFTEGGEIKAGQALYQIDPARYQANYQSAQATLAQSEATLNAARLKAERYKQLIAIKAVGQQEADDVEANYQAALASVQASQAAVNLAALNLKYTHVNSPISGRIGKSTVTQGALVTAEQGTPLATVQQLNPIYVDIVRSSRELLQLKRELAEGHNPEAAVVKLLLEDNSEYPLSGKLQFTDISVNDSTGSVTLRALFPNPKQELLPGMLVRARLVEAVHKQAILVPQDSVAHDPKGNAIAYVVNTAGKVEIRSLVATRHLGNQWLVRQGLNTGDTLIVDGLQTIAPGMTVITTPVTPDLANSGRK